MRLTKQQEDYAIDETTGGGHTGEQNTSTTMFTGFSFARTCYTNDIEQWIRDCESGVLYEKLRSLVPTHRQKFEYAVWNTSRVIPIDIAKMTAKRFKRQVLQVLFDRNEQAKNNPIWEAIENHYPTIARGIQLLKSGKGHEAYKTAAKLSQIWEVEIMIHKIAAEHIRRGIPIITVHDEIVTPAPELTRRIMKQEFANIGLNPAIH
jgi:hypothetical protein